MKHKKWIVVAVVGMLALTGCGSEDKNTFGSDKMQVRVVELPAGGEVVCVTYNQEGYVGGVSCDWEGTR